jgi:DNA-directed RNA polymerase subunit RPC12/RpoP
MTIDFICQRCDASFEVEYSEILEGEGLQCPNCDQKAAKKPIEDFGNALDELMARTADLRSKFLLSVTVESEDLPPPYDEEAGAEEDSEGEDESETDDSGDDDEDDDDFDEDEGDEDVSEDEDDR